MNDLEKIKYTCEITNGCGEKEDGGVWTKKETPKLITFEYIKDSSFGDPLFKKIRISKTGKFFGDVLRDWEDGTYTAYPKQGGTPYYFEQIK